MNDEKSNCSDQTNKSMFNYLVTKYDNRFDQYHSNFVNMSDKHGFGVCNYYHISFVDKKFVGGRIMLYFGILVSFAIFLDKRLKYLQISSRLTHATSIHVFKSMEKYFQTAMNGKYKSFLKVSNSWDCLHDDKFEKYLIDKFGENYKVDHANKYSSIIAALYINKSNINSDWKAIDFWKLLIRSHVSQQNLEKLFSKM